MMVPANNQKIVSLERLAWGGLHGARVPGKAPGINAGNEPWYPGTMPDGEGRECLALDDGASK
jgi:hypothetical protein